MSALKVNQIKTKLRQKFEKHLDLSDLGQNDPDRDSKVLTRCLAALAIQLRTACADIDAAKAVWDGSDDNGIDGAYFDPAESRVILVQSKWIQKGTGEPEAKDILAFTKGVWDLVEQETTMFHPRLHARLNDIMLRMANPGTSLHIVLVSTGSSKLAPHGTSVIDKLLGELNGEDPNEIASSETLGLDEVYSGLAADAGAAQVTLDAQLFDWSFIATPYHAYFGTIDGLQLKAWWKNHGRRAVASNIRHALGATEVNTQIKQTAGTAPEKFWYFNNGITVVAQEVTKAPAGAASRTAGNFTFKGASVVNGAQTISSLGSVEDDNSLGRVRVPIRVIDLKTAPAEFGKDVTRTNNLQNRIEPRDFVAQDPEQTRIRQEMAMEGVDYQFVRSEETAPTSTSCDLIEVTTALACASDDTNLAVQIKTGSGRFFNDLSKAPYKTLFNPNTTGAKAFNATLVLRAVDDWIDSKKKKLAKKSGPEWGTLVHGNRILASLAFKAIGGKILSQPIAQFQPALKTQDLKSALDAAHHKMVEVISNNYQGRPLAVLFKNPTVSKDVFDQTATALPKA